MEEKELFAIEFSKWKDDNFTKHHYSDNYFPKYKALSNYDEKVSYTLEELLNFYKRDILPNK